MRDVRTEGAWAASRTRCSTPPRLEADIQDDIEFALIQMKSETLNKINEALARLEEGAYGNCFECGEEIAERRLRALPFAVRCKDCEEAREVAEQRERQLAAASARRPRFSSTCPARLGVPTIAGSARGRSPVVAADRRSPTYSFVYAQ